MRAESSAASCQPRAAGPEFQLRITLGAGLLTLTWLSLCALACTGSEQGSGRGRAAVPRDETRDRLRMVERQIEARGIRDPRVLEAMNSVPRHEFIPAELRHAAYADHPLPIGEGQTISQPYIVALMTESLEVGAGDRVLELGTGSGYQAAVLAALVDTVFTIEYFATLAEQAQETFARLGYENILVKAGDGWAGWPEHAPFDAAIVTFASPTLPPAVVEQLKVGGRLCIPIGEAHGTQMLMLYTKREDGSLARRSLCAVRFVPVLGEGAKGEGLIGEEP